MMNVSALRQLPRTQLAPSILRPPTSQTIVPYEIQSADCSRPCFTRLRAGPLDGLVLFRAPPVSEWGMDRVWIWVWIQTRYILPGILGSPIGQSFAA